MGHCLCVAAIRDGLGRGVSLHRDEKGLLTPSFLLHSLASPAQEPGVGTRVCGWEQGRLRMAFPGQGPPGPAVPGAQVLIAIFHNMF